jgi:DNA-binding MarR family transcriptional regulator
MQLLPEAKKSSPTRDACAGALLNALPGLVWFVRRQMRSRRAKGLSVPQFRTLAQLRRRPAVSLSIVSEALGASAPTASRIISGLVSKGLVVRRTSEQDRRRVSLQLTPRGHAVIESAWTGTQCALAAKLANLTKSQLAGLADSLALLSELFSSAGHAAEEGSPRDPAGKPGILCETVRIEKTRPKR